MTAKVSIQETNVTTSASGWVVQLCISDAERADVNAQIAVELIASLPARTPEKLLAAVQPAALVAVDDQLTEIRQLRIKYRNQVLAP